MITGWGGGCGGGEEAVVALRVEGAEVAEGAKDSAPEADEDCAEGESGEAVE